MPYRYQCFECDAVLMSETPQIICPECSEMALEHQPPKIGEYDDLKLLKTTCIHCGNHLECEDDQKALVQLKKGVREWVSTGYNPGMSDGIPRICRRCYWGN